MNFLDGMIHRTLEDLTTPKEGRTCYLNRYWIVHPEKGATFYKNIQSPQCNTNKQMVEVWVNRFPGYQVVHIPVAYF